MGALDKVVLNSSRVIAPKVDMSSFLDPAQKTLQSINATRMAKQEFDAKQADRAARLGIAQAAEADRKSELLRQQQERDVIARTAQNFDGTTAEYGANYSGVDVFNEGVQKAYESKLATAKAAGATPEQLNSMGVDQADIQPLLGKLNQADSYGFTGSNFASEGLTDKEFASNKLRSELLSQGVGLEKAAKTAALLTDDLTDRTALTATMQTKLDKEREAANKYNMDLYKEDRKTYNAGVTATGKSSKYGTSDVVEMVKRAETFDDNYIFGKKNKTKAKDLSGEALRLGYHPKDIVAALATESTDNRWYFDKYIKSNNVQEFMENALPNLKGTDVTANPAPLPPEMQKYTGADILDDKEDMRKFFFGEPSPVESNIPTNNAPGIEEPTVEPTSPQAPPVGSRGGDFFTDTELAARNAEDRNFLQSTEKEIAQEVINNPEATQKELNVAKSTIKNVERGQKLKNYITRGNTGLMSEDSKQQWSAIFDVLSKGGEITGTAIHSLLKATAGLSQSTQDAIIDIFKDTNKVSPTNGDAFSRKHGQGLVTPKPSTKAPKREDFLSDTAYDIKEEQRYIDTLKTVPVNEALTKQRGKFLDENGTLWFFRDGQLLSQNRGL